MNLYSEFPFYITLVNFGSVNVQIPKHQSVGEVVKAPVDIVYIKKARHAYAWLKSK